MMTHRLTGGAQVWLSVLFITGYFAVLLCFMAGWVRVPIEYKDAFTVLLGALTGSLINIVTFWFSRSRDSFPDADPRQP